MSTKLQRNAFPAVVSKMSSLNDLPLEVLENVLFFISDPKSKSSVALTCSQFRNIVRSDLKKINKITVDFLWPSKLRDWRRIQDTLDHLPNLAELEINMREVINFQDTELIANLCKPTYSASEKLRCVKLSSFNHKY